MAQARRAIDGLGTCLLKGWLEQRCTTLALELEACRREIDRRTRLVWLYFAIGLMLGFLIRVAI